jgi:hypothetical protein
MYSNWLVLDHVIMIYSDEINQIKSSILWGLYNRPKVAAEPRDLVPPPQKKGLNTDQDI